MVLLWGRRSESPFGEHHTRIRDLLHGLHDAAVQVPRGDPREWRQQQQRERELKQIREYGIWPGPRLVDVVHGPLGAGAPGDVSPLTPVHLRGPQSPAALCECNCGRHRQPAGSRHHARIRDRHLAASFAGGGPRLHEGGADGIVGAVVEPGRAAGTLNVQLRETLRRRPLLTAVPVLDDADHQQIQDEERDEHRMEERRAQGRVRRSVTAPAAVRESPRKERDENRQEDERNDDRLRAGHHQDEHPDKQCDDQAGRDGEPRSHVRTALYPAPRTVSMRSGRWSLART